MTDLSFLPFPDDIIKNIIDNYMAKITEYYEIHDNYNIPFQVKTIKNELTNKYISATVDFFKIFCDDLVYDSDEYDSDEYENNNPIIFIKNPYQIFIGSSYKAEYDYSIGNSILIQPTKDLEYIFVGPRIFKFKTDEPISVFISPIGPNDVPYTYAISKSKLYLLSERVVVDTRHIDKYLMFCFADSGKNHKDPYTYYYRHDKSFLNKSVPLEYELIQKRL